MGNNLCTHDTIGYLLLNRRSFATELLRMIIGGYRAEVALELEWSNALPRRGWLEALVSPSRPDAK
jgi:hypothetical protein